MALIAGALKAPGIPAFDFIVTAHHRTFPGVIGNGLEFSLTTALKAGDRLTPKFPGTRIAKTTPSPFGIAHGFTYGDGTRSGTGSPSRPALKVPSSR